MDTIFKDKEGKPVYVLGLQSHNSSNGCWELIDTAIEAVKKYHGNTLEVPVYWFQLEPKEGQFDLTVTEELIKRVRNAGLHLVILWFGFSKNTEMTYLPEWAKDDPQRFRLAVSWDGSPIPLISPHYEAAIEADKKAFVQLMGCIKRVDEKERTVLAVQVENEVGLQPTDRCYSTKAQEDFEKGVPAALNGVTLEGAGASGKDNTWYGRFGYHAHEAFSAWYFGVAIEKIAAAGKAVYPDLPLYMNTMIGEVRQEIAGHSYSSGSPVGRVLDIWKRAAPSICLYAPDIYMAHHSGYVRTCKIHTRPDNALFIPETGTGGDAFALDYIHAAVDYGAIGICGFGAEHTLDSGGALTEDSQKVATSTQIIASMAPILLKDRLNEKLFCVTQEEFELQRYVKREKYHLTFNFTNRTPKGGIMGRSLRVGALIADNPEVFTQRGRAIVYEASPAEFYMAGVGLTVRFIYRAEPDDHCPPKTWSTQAATEISAYTVEEGHFTPDGEWVCEFQRRGDEIGSGAYLYPGTVVRVKLNPKAHRPIAE
jgi:hypothetical protein